MSNIELKTAELEEIPYRSEVLLSVTEEDLIAICPWWDRMEVVEDWRIEYYKGAIFLEYDENDRGWQELFRIETKRNVSVEDALYDREHKCFYLKYGAMPEAPAQLPRGYLLQKVSAEGQLVWEVPLMEYDTLKMALGESGQRLFLLGQGEYGNEKFLVDCETGDVEKGKLQKDPARQAAEHPIIFAVPQSGKGTTAVYCLDQDGILVWETEIEASDYRYTAADDKQVFLVSPYSTEMIQLDAQTGTVTKKISLPKAGQMNTYGDVLAVGDSVFVLSTGGAVDSIKAGIIQYDKKTEKKAQFAASADGYYGASAETFGGTAKMFFKSADEGRLLVYTLSAAS